MHNRFLPTWMQMFRKKTETIQWIDARGTQTKQVSRKHYRALMKLLKDPKNCQVINHILSTL